MLQHQLLLGIRHAKFQTLYHLFQKFWLSGQYYINLENGIIHGFGFVYL